MVFGANLERSLAIIKPATEKTRPAGAEVAGMHSKHIASLETILYFFHCSSTTVMGMQTFRHDPVREDWAHLGTMTPLPSLHQ